ncbi:MAG: hypothetical protein JW934_14310 [Anaerolineae bacterium]|nr:hypothetical protein [Anaerolineae bacterium]
MSAELYSAPEQMTDPDGRARFAFVTFLMLNDGYLPGALLLAYALRQQRTRADLICLVTDEITPGAREALALLFDHVVEVPEIFVPHKRRQERQDRPFWFTRLNALRFGADGDRGFRYQKVVVLDADVLPLRHYDHLFRLDAPAGIINEDKYHFIEVNPDGSYHVSPDVEQSGTWNWHRIYGDICPHGQRIPREITDRIRDDPANLGIHGALFIFEPSMAELLAIQADLERPEIQERVGDLYCWPDMQYLTLRWSGRWTNVDLRFAAFNGYPALSVLFGTHFAGLKPWQFRRDKAIVRWGRYDDFQLWFRQYTAMVGRDYPSLQKLKRLKRLLEDIEALNRSLHNDGLV